MKEKREEVVVKRRAAVVVVDERAGLSLSAAAVAAGIVFIWPMPLSPASSTFLFFFNIFFK